MKAPVVGPGRKRAATGCLFLKNSQFGDQQRPLLDEMRELLVAARDRRRIGANLARDLVDACLDLLFHRVCFFIGSASSSDQTTKRSTNSLTGVAARRGASMQSS